MVGGRATEVEKLKERGEDLDLLMVRRAWMTRPRQRLPTRTRVRARAQMANKDLKGTDEWGAGVEQLKAACAMLAENGHPGVVYDAAAC